jgi:hypothetical protein
VPIDVDLEFTRGGRTALDFLSYCVMAYRLEPLFDYLVRDYRTRPTGAGAVTLFDMFCAPAGPARLRAGEPHLPPRELRLVQDLDRVRGLLHAPVPLEDSDASGSPARATAPGSHAPVHVPAPRHLFDGLVERLRGGERDLVALPGLDFDPTLTPARNLPGGRMSEGQRAWVEKVWVPGVRPRLVAAGFWRVAALG